MRTVEEDGIPSRDAIDRQISRKNWGRWGPDDQRGAINLIDSAKVTQAAGLVRLGRTIGLGRPLETDPGPHNPHPADYAVSTIARAESGGAVMEQLGVAFHGTATTHLDGLGHVWDGDGMWGGRDPATVVGADGVSWGGIQAWRDGIVTRGVLVDVPRHRGKPYVTVDEPVHGWELDEIIRAQGTSLQPGDALVVHCGRDAYSEAEGPWGGAGVGRVEGSEGPSRPGLHPSCLEFLRDFDVSMLVWDMLDSVPTGYGTAWSVHSAIFAYGMALLDNARLDELAQVCFEHGRTEFMLTAAPLVIIGGSGSPINPLAIL